MGKRIRHLEFYGFPDQNVFDGIPNVDLSDIRETNKNQDREIDEISGQTQGKADMSVVEELSGKVDTFISSQTLINDEVAQSLSSITDTVNGMADTVNANEEAISSLTESFNEHIEEFNSHIEDFNDFSANTESVLSGKLDSMVAEETYAKKAEVYSREEADATFLKDPQDLSHLALKSDLEALQAQVDSLDDKYATDEELNALDEKVEGYKESIESEISGITSSITSVDEDIEAIKGDIETIKGDISTINVSITTINETLDSVEETVYNKVDRAIFNEVVDEIDDRVTALDNKKADKSDLLTLSGNVDSLNAAIGREIVDRQNGDTELSGRIVNLENDVNDLTNSLSDINNNIGDLRDDLTQEIANRKAADIALIGEEGDSASSDTIWGAKEYANVQRTLAVGQAKAYTDEKLSGIDTLIDNKFDEFDTKLSGKADKTYVDDLVAERVSGATESLNNRIDDEVAALETSDENIEAEIEELRGIIGSGNTKDIYKRINIITTYSGDTAEEYIDDGNGILDVLHREFHQLEDEIGVVANPTLVKTNEYEAAFGKYNASYTSEDASGRTIFSIGIGTGNYDRKNALEVRENGDIYMWVENEFMPINTLLGMLAHEMY